MKYMGSKRSMLKNGLGQLFRAEAKHASRFVDLFTGSGAVATFVAQNCEVPVLAIDIQSFCTTLASAVISRTKPLDFERTWTNWARSRRARITQRRIFKHAEIHLPSQGRFTRKYVTSVRETCAESDSDFPVTRAYGGHYFGRSQAYWIDALRLSLPTERHERAAALAALISAASQCAASPGHTAQPFQPTTFAKQFLYESWGRSILDRTRTQFIEISRQHALVRGRTSVSDANVAVDCLTENDVVFVDPPYSGVHYSRFYHVLETISRGSCGSVSGVGRYPPKTERPQSKYSLQTQSRDAVSCLLCGIAERRAVAVVTFPDKKCSNGISSYLLRRVAKESFSKVETRVVRGRFSTLGGDGAHRDARQTSNELIMVLRP